MSILFGHPGGGPFSYHAALAHFEARRLEAFCVPWAPSPTTVQLLERAGAVFPVARRFGRRQFPLLADAPKVQGRLGEMRRLIIRALGCGDEGLSYEANDWLMRTMTRECKRPAVSAVHAYEDCALWQFEEAKRFGKACIYDMPIGYYPAWEKTQQELAQRFADWLPPGGLPSSRYVRPQQKRQEMDLADLVLAPSSFVADTIRAFHPHKHVAVAPYGVDLEFWRPEPRKRTSDAMRFIYAGQASLRKGLPVLLQAWQKAGVRDAELLLVGPWFLRESRRTSLPSGVTHVPAGSREMLREQYHRADAFVLPSFFEGLALVLLEAMACGLPAIASSASGGADVVNEACGHVLPAGDLNALVDTLRWFGEHRDRLPAMGRAARERAEQCTWERYRRCVTQATAPLV
jgi:alpha-maltose-1-phosphate synthase